jgi:hypothetical protein
MNDLLLGLLVIMTVPGAIGCSSDDTRKEATRQFIHMQKEGNRPSGSHESMSSGAAQKTCPVMGNPINKDLYVDYNGKRIYVCCGMCIDKVEKDSEKYLKKLEDMGEQPEIL